MALGAAALAGCGSGSGSAASSAEGRGPIVVAAISDRTGPLSVYGLPKIQALKLAVKDIDDHGGVLGRKLKLVVYDSQSDPAKAAQFASQAALRDRAAVVMGVSTSAQREAVRAALDRTGTLYFHNMPNEGGLCDKEVVSTGLTSSQQISQLIPWAIHHYGRRIYIVAADYNFGHDSATWVKHYAARNGGTVVGTRFLPLTNSEFGSVISDIQRKRPDVVFATLVGAAQLQFVPQFHDAGLAGSVHLVSNSFGVGGEQAKFASSAQGIVNAFAYYPSNRNAANRRLLALWRSAEGNGGPPPTEAAVAEWNGIHLWAKAVEQAKSAETQKVIQAVEGGHVQYDGPSGVIRIDPKTHNAVSDVTIGEVDAHGGYQLLHTSKAVQPEFEQSKCDLPRHPVDQTLVP